MKKILTLRIAGLVVITSPAILTNQSISDLSKGLLTGAGIGLLVLSVVLQFKKPKTT